MCCVQDGEHGGWQGREVRVQEHQGVVQKLPEGARKGLCLGWRAGGDQAGLEERGDLVKVS